MTPQILLIKKLKKRWQVSFNKRKLCRKIRPVEIESARDVVNLQVVTHFRQPSHGVSNRETKCLAAVYSWLNLTALCDDWLAFRMQQAHYSSITALHPTTALTQFLQDEKRT